MTEGFIANRPLPVGSKGHRASGWWGMLALILTESCLFAYLFFSYFYLASHAVGQWPPNGPPDLTIAVPGTFILIAGSVAMWWGERGIERGRPGQLLIGLVAALVLGLAFIVLELKEWSGQPFTLSTSVYSSLYLTITGFHLLHVAVGMLMLAALLLWTALGYFGSARHSAVSIGGIYWHFVTVVWLGVLFTFYVVPRLS
ncbi:MAG: cytochrome c oxidase subunit 3 [Bryobacteraceae bacterium]